MTTLHADLAMPHQLVSATARIMVMAPSGELDIHTSPTLTHRLDALTAADRPHIVLDLTAVTFIDCSGLAALCRARRHAAVRGGRLSLVVSDARILRTFQATRLTQVFTIHPSLADALANGMYAVEGAESSPARRGEA